MTDNPLGLVRALAGFILTREEHVMHPDEFQIMIDDTSGYIQRGDGLKPSTLGHLQKPSAHLTPRVPVYLVTREGDEFFHIEGVFASREGAEAYIKSQEVSSVWDELFCTKWDVQP